MLGKTIIRDVFGFSGRIGLGRFFALLAFEVCAFFGLFVVSVILINRMPGTMDRLLGDILLLGCLVAVPVALLALLVRAARNLFYPLPFEAAGPVPARPCHDAVMVNPAAIGEQTVADEEGLYIVKGGGLTRWIVLLFGMLALVARPDKLPPTSLPFMAWLGWVMLALGGAVAAYDIVFGKREIRLNAEGFSIKTLLATVSFRWDDVVAPFVAVSGARSGNRVEFLVNPAAAGLTAPVQRRISNSYEMDPADLAKLLNAYRDEALNPHGAGALPRRQALPPA